MMSSQQNDLMCRVGAGTPAFPTSFRWGYGWPAGRGYGPLTPAERRAADAALAEVRRTNPDLTCKGAGVTGAPR